MAETSEAESAIRDLALSILRFVSIYSLKSPAFTFSLCDPSSREPAAGHVCLRSRRDRRRSRGRDRGRSQGGSCRRCRRAAPSVVQGAEQRNDRRPSACMRDCRRTERAPRRVHRDARSRRRSRAHTFQGMKNSTRRRPNIPEPAAPRIPPPPYATNATCAKREAAHEPRQGRPGRPLGKPGDDDGVILRGRAAH
jgi:hypothetical protein